MIERIRFLWQLLVLSAILLLLGILLIPALNMDLPLHSFIITLLSVSLINFITYLLLIRGIQNQNREGIIFLLGGIGVKFILYLVYILVFWGVTKNLSKGFIITFFALYLIFTFFLAGILLKSLKNN